MDSPLLRSFGLELEKQANRRAIRWALQSLEKTAAFGTIESMKGQPASNDKWWARRSKKMDAGVGSIRDMPRPRRGEVDHATERMVERTRRMLTPDESRAYGRTRRAMWNLKPAISRQVMHGASAPSGKKPGLFTRGPMGTKMLYADDKPPKKMFNVTTLGRKELFETPKPGKPMIPYAGTRELTRERFSNAANTVNTGKQRGDVFGRLGTVGGVPKNEVQGILKGMKGVDTDPLTRGTFAKGLRQRYAGRGQGAISARQSKRFLRLALSLASRGRIKLGHTLHRLHHW